MTKSPIAYVKVVFTTLLLLTLYTTQAYAVKIIPPRLVILPETTIEHIFVKNNSNKVEAFRFGWKHIAMDKEGNVINLDKFGRDKVPAYKSADTIIRFSPRRAVLKPGQTQRVTMMIRRPPALEDGEYRNHFFVQREPKAQPSEIINENAEPNNTKGDSPSVQIDVSVSRAVPIYVLHGTTNADLKILGAALKENKNREKEHQPKHHVHFNVEKIGNRSIIGIANVFCKNQDGDDIKISKPAKTFAVYAEGQFRKEKLAVQLPPQGCSDIRLVLTGHHNDLRAGEVLGEIGVMQ